MKKFLLFLAVALVTFTAYSQSLVVYSSDHLGNKNVQADASGNLPTIDYTCVTDQAFAEQIQYYLYVENTSSVGGNVSFSATPLNDFATSNFGIGFCYEGRCTNVPTGSFSIQPLGFYNGGAVPGFDMTLSPKTLVDGVAEFKIDFTLEGEQESTTVFITVNFKTKSSGVASAEVLGNLRVYQDAAGNVVADYGFGNDGDRTLSIVSLSGQKVYECPVDGASGTMTLPVDLGRGVYLYSVTEGGQLLSSHKFVVR